MSNHPCWITAMHEVSHIAVFLKLGGKWGNGKNIRITPNSGGVRLGGLWDYEHGFFLDYCVYAAGVAADRIQGVPSFNAPGSDMNALIDLAIDHRFTPEHIELVIARVQLWLRKHNRAIEWAAEALIAARRTDGKVPMTKSKQIIEQLITVLPCRRKMMRRKKR